MGARRRENWEERKTMKVEGKEVGGNGVERRRRTAAAKARSPSDTVWFSSGIVNRSGSSVGRKSGFWTGSRNMTSSMTSPENCDDDDDDCPPRNK